MRRLVAEIVGDDPRFEVIGWDDNLGFYLNFERLLLAVPDDAAWVALSDQDDRWYPDKLERLVPLLDETHAGHRPGPSGRVAETGGLLDDHTATVVPAEDLALREPGHRRAFGVPT